MTKLEFRGPKTVLIFLAACLSVTSPAMAICQSETNIDTMSMDSTSINASPGSDTSVAQTVNPRLLFDQAIKELTAGNSNTAINLLEEAHNASNGDKQIALFLIDGLVKRGLYKESEAQKDRHHVSKVSMVRPKGASDFEDAAKVAERVLKLHSELQESEREFLGNAIFHHSRALAMEGEREVAISALKDSLDAGFSGFEQIDETKAFRKLRNEEAFEELVEDRRVEYLEEVEAELRKQIKQSQNYSFKFALQSSKGGTVSSESLKGKIVIADIWATWCGPCCEEVPHFCRLQKKYGDKLAVVGINYEKMNTAAEAIQRIELFQERVDMNYPCLLGDATTYQQIPNFNMFPTTVFKDASGTVRLTLTGPQSLLKLQTAVRILVEEQEAKTKVADQANVNTTTTVSTQPVVGQ